MASGCPAAGVHKMLQRGDSKMSLSGSFKVGAVGDAEMFQVEPAIFVAISQMRTMVLEYLPTKLSDFGGFNVGKYSSTMEHMGWLKLVKYIGKRFIIYII